MARPQSELTKLILTLPMDLSVAEVIERAKEAGMETNEKNVSRVRADQKKRLAAGAQKPAVKPPAAKKPAAKAEPTGAPAALPTAAGTMTKADFVRGLPRTMSAKDIVAHAKAAGIELTEKYVYKARTPRKGAKAAAKPATAVRPVPVAKAPATVQAPTPPKTAPTGSDEVALRKLVLALGVTRSRQLLDELERGLAALIAG
jgi:hypothetical protein